LVLASQVAMARARGGHASRFLMPTGASSTGETASDWLVWQRFSRVERVTGIEPHCQLGKSSYPTVFSCPAPVSAASASP
jgi:hypothetical protein